MTDREIVRYTIDCGASVPLQVQRFLLDESLDRTYLCTVEVAGDDLDPDLEMFLGVDAVIEVIRGGKTRRLTGIVRAARHAHEVRQGVERTPVYLEIVPALFMSSLRRNTRMFQEKTVSEILEDVLGEALSPYGREYSLELNDSYPTREYTIQYQETDLDFVQRLMQEEGISYSFDHEADTELLVLRDDNGSYQPALGAEEPVPFTVHDQRITDTEPVKALERVHSLRTTKVALREHDWTKATPLVEDEVGDADALGRTRESYEHGHKRSVLLWQYRPDSYGQNDAARQKQLRLEEHEMDVVVGYGRGQVIGFAPGTTFELQGHPTPGVDGEYLLLRVIHSSGDPDSEEPGKTDYHNRFECMPLDVPHQPPRVYEKPRIPSIQTAVVTGPAGEEIHTDEYGRIKVQFHWDRENPADETSSCWIRVQQKWSGEQWGFWWLPRIGMEVVVQFIDGDPDRPLATGCVYDGNNPTPYPLPDEKTKSTIKSNSSPGGGGFNEFRFEDKKGSEEIYTHAQKDYNEVVENDHTTLVHNCQTNEVDNDQTQTIHNNQTERVDVDQSLSVGGNRSLHIEGDFDETVDGTETRTVTGAVEETFDANETRMVSSNLTEDFQANETRTIGGSQTETVGASRTQTITGSSSQTVSGSLTQTVAAGITLDTPATWEQTATGGYTALLPGGLTVTAPGGMKVGAPGGVKQIDCNSDKTAGVLSTKGAIVRGLAGFKFEAFGLNVCGLADSHGGSLLEAQVGPTVHFKATLLGKIGAKVHGGAVKADQGPRQDA